MSTVARSVCIPVAGGGEGAVLRTPMERNHPAAGADVRGPRRLAGGRLPRTASPATPGLADVSHHGKLDVRGPPRRDRPAERRARAGQGQPRRRRLDAADLSPSHAVVLCPFSRVEQLRTRIASESDGDLRHRHDLRLGGRDARRRAGARRVHALVVAGRAATAGSPAGACMAGSVMRCGSIILNEDGSLLGALRLGVRRVHVGVAARRGGDARHHPGVGRGRRCAARWRHDRPAAKAPLLPRPRPQVELRRRHHRRRRARPGHGLLPGQAPRRQADRRARPQLHGRGRLRPQHHHHPLQLPDARGRPLLRGEREAVRDALAGPQLQHAVLPARAPDAGPLRPLA